MSQKHSLVHIGIIMDGNRRWAKNQGLPSLEGHRRGYDKMKEVTKWCIKRDIKILTVYAFSTENWNRSKKEVEYLMNLFRLALSKDIAEMDKQGVKVKVIGQQERLAPDIQAMVKEAEAKTKNNKKLLFNVAISYGGRPDILQAIKKLVKQKIPAAKITEELISKNLWTHGIADPDLIVRTSGEYRLSGFLTWQSVYSELIFIKKHWPDFGENDLDKIIKEYNKRQRRFGK
ncbi:MAG: di-trans,poly-cis-decaprenylcistransferase [Candidatus Buchananbacteria bacterium RIFCSPHIGHO2_02_FULL_38_8]|uniref:Isoprenyl transferase n=2 Tax=Candidatus Buchananiibacteriota TaxID=1817903 RepID=A0A1G1Y3M2_9BACT|nr:MAG: di-trans,poly-cis-decaprenylcistransferase [Candidatus Buchananbacteria bacterium RIFCSPHIGHO2_01_FULL_39_8]OGY47262.1 MAG: di-trans,poly-cis-decaprenylcistransferase [Candidatus Buchananbacteria bacterium RIFCSPHIGHO2_02_FULL_38_8]